MTRNRAKCKLCGDVLESFTLQDYVECSCGEIAISGGSYELKVYARNWENFLRLTELDNEIAVAQEHNREADNAENDGDYRISLKELLYGLESAANGIRGLPVHASTSPVTHVDHLSLIVVTHELFKRIIDNLEGINKLLIGVKP